MNERDGPVEDRYVATMEHIAALLDRAFNGDRRGDERDTGFVLLVFPFGSGDGRCNYVSNGADRADVLKLLQEQAKRFEEGL